MGNDAVWDLKLVLISFRAFRNFFCSDSNFKPIAIMRDVTELILQ